MDPNLKGASNRFPPILLFDEYYSISMRCPSTVRNDQLFNCAVGRDGAAVAVSIRKLMEGDRRGHREDKTH